MRVSITAFAALCLASCSSNEPADNTMNVDNLATENLTVDETPKVFCEAVRQRVTADECIDLTALKEDVRTGAAALDVPNPMTRGRAAEVTLVVDRRPLPQIAEAEQPPDPTDDITNAADDASDTADDADNVSFENVAMNAVEPEPADQPDDVQPGDEPATLTPNQVAEELPGEDHPFYSRVGQYMKATLVGNGFDIKLIEPGDAIQEIPPGGQGTWIWEVIPRTEGSRTLTALTEAVGQVDGRAIPLGNGRTSKTVAVEVRAIDRIWDMIVAAPLWLKALAAVGVAFGTLLGAWLAVRAQWRSRAK